MSTSTLYPTPEHGRSAEIVAAHFAERAGVNAVLLTCSCARGVAAPESCLDITVLIDPERLQEQREEMEAEWEQFQRQQRAFAEMERHGPYALVDLEFSDGVFAPGHHGWCTGPDNFELEIGNLVAYAVPLWERGDAFQRLRQQWLPYYDEPMRAERLHMVLRYGLNNLDHIPRYVRRGLYFQAFQRLYHAFGEFLQALFISRRTYPVAYNKWIKQQIVELLGEPDLYSRLPRLFEIQHFESDEIARKGQDLQALVREFVTP